LSEPVYVLAYDPEWPNKFEAERVRLEAALAALHARIEHMGSTAVPGLDAKPIIDIMIIVESVTDAIRAITPLVQLDYECRGELEIPGRIYFRRGTPRSHQIHLYVDGNPEIERHLLFRDYLRTHPEAARQYANLKHALALRHRDDRLAYTDAKTEFILEIEARAREAGLVSQVAPGGH
jgi:GrpB-like predicted nucleotidyltransferase (UPF0157 family)